MSSHSNSWIARKYLQKELFSSQRADVTFIKLLPRLSIYNFNQSSHTSGGKVPKIVYGLRKNTCFLPLLQHAKVEAIRQTGTYKCAFTCGHDIAILYKKEQDKKTALLDVWYMRCIVERRCHPLVHEVNRHLLHNLEYLTPLIVYIDRIRRKGSWSCKNQEFRIQHKSLKRMDRL